MAPAQWHWVTSSATGQVQVAGVIPGQMHTSTDFGATWSVGNSPSGAWISIDMTPTGDRIVAVGFNGNMYLSTDRGVNWTQLTSPTVNLVGREFESVSISDDGLRIAANILNDGIFVSQDGGATWVRGTTATGGVLTSGWRGLDSTADGTFLISVSQDNVVYTSADAGLTWTLRPVVVGGVALTDDWYRTAMSANGSVIAIAANTFGGAAGTGLYLSRDRGVTWSRAGTMAGDFTAIDISADGQIIAVTLSATNGQTGGVYLSTDGGATFNPLNPGSDTVWRAISVSGDGTQLTVAAGSFLGVSGQLYTGSRAAVTGQ
jgi:hypothetical protein